MAKTWVLDTETKGTGAHIAPLERDSRRASSKLSLVPLHPPAGASEGVERRQDGRDGPKPRTRLKVVDVLSGRVLGEDLTAGEALGALAGARKAIDVLVYVREREGARWRLLSLADTRSLWERRLAAERPA